MKPSRHRALGRAALAAAAALACGPLAAAAQRPDSSSAPAPPSAAPPPDAPSRIDFSGILYANYQYGGTPAARSANRFDVERAYITLRNSPRDRVSFRITADVFQQRDSTRDAYYAGWAVRAKYAYLQYDYLSGDSSPLGLKANARIGILHTVVIDHEELFWPRWISQVSTERYGFFSSADAGVATTVTLPGSLGEFYGTVTNGPGYQSRETDRFKDIAARLTLTPLRGRSKGFLQTLEISPWAYKGATASDFARKRGTVLPVSASRKRDRWGVFLDLRDPRLTVGLDYAERTEAVDQADTTRDVSPTTTDRKTSLASAFTIVRPFAPPAVGAGQPAVHPSPLAPLGVLVRVDHTKPMTPHDVSFFERERATDLVIAGVTWDLGRRATVALDYQEQDPRHGSTLADTKTYFLHFVANF